MLDKRSSLIAPGGGGGGGGVRNERNESRFNDFIAITKRHKLNRVRFKVKMCKWQGFVIILKSQCKHSK